MTNSNEMQMKSRAFSAHIVVVNETTLSDLITIEAKVWFNLPIADALIDI